MTSEDKVNVLTHYKLGSILHIHVNYIAEELKLIGGRWIIQPPF